MKRRIVVGITGASGAAIGVRVIELLNKTEDCEVHLVVSVSGERTLSHEVGVDALLRLNQLVLQRYAVDDVGASIASGSFRTDGMIIAPCSIRTLSAVAASAADNLVVRAADVHLKERRRLVLLVRETPLHLGHLRAMAAATEHGAVIVPPVPAFYLHPMTVAEIVDQIARRAISLLDVSLSTSATEWGGLNT